MSPLLALAANFEVLAALIVFAVGNHAACFSMWAIICFTLGFAVTSAAMSNR